MAYKKNNKNALGINWIKYKEQVGARVKSVREENGISYQVMAEAIGTHYPTIIMWESGESLPSTKLLKTFCEIYNVSADWLLDIDWE